MIGAGSGCLATSVKHDACCVRLGSRTVQCVGRCRCTVDYSSSTNSRCAVDGGILTGMVGSSPAYGCPRVFPTVARHTLCTVTVLLRLFSLFFFFFVVPPSHTVVPLSKIINVYRHV